MTTTIVIPAALRAQLVAALAAPGDVIITTPAPNQPPVASFAYSVNGNTAAFIDQSTDADGTIATRAWAFGDGGTATGAQVTHAYTAPGSYVVALTVTDNGGMQGVKSQTITIDSAPPVFAWQAPRDPSAFPILPKPAKGAAFTTPYGTTEKRLSDHARDISGSPMFRNDYSRRQPYNADGSRLLGYIGNGLWGLIDPRTGEFITKLTGPAGDAELQWDATDPNAVYYLPNNGGTVLRKLNIATMVSTVVYDFTTEVKALFGTTAARCWTKSEGSPSKDGRLWGLMVETNNFAPLGFVVLDVVAKRVVWSKPNSARPDHVSMSPSGKWFVRSGYNDGIGAVAYAIDGSNRVLQLAANGEHSDIGLLPNGHDFYISVDYQSGEGDIYATDLETGVRKVIDRAYHNLWAPGTYSMHFSAKAYDAPGWIVQGRYGAPNGPANIVLQNVLTGQTIALGCNYPVWSNYFDEPHACPDRKLTRVAANGNFGTSQNEDVYEFAVPALPAPVMMSGKIEPAPWPRVMEDDITIPAFRARKRTSRPALLPEPGMPA